MDKTDILGLGCGFTTLSTYFQLQHQISQRFSNLCLLKQAEETLDFLPFSDISYRPGNGQHHSYPKA